jgi:putative membrane protein
MSADRTLMSVIRTSLSLIGFDFTIFQFLRDCFRVGDVPRSAKRRAQRSALC